MKRAFFSFLRVRDGEEYSHKYSLVPRPWFVLRKAPATLLIAAFALSVQMLTQWKRSVRYGYYRENRTPNGTSGVHGPHWELMNSNQGSANLFCKGPDSEYFWLGGLQGLCCGKTAPDNKPIHTNRCGWIWPTGIHLLTPELEDMLATLPWPLHSFLSVYLFLKYCYSCIIKLLCYSLSG